MTGVEANIIRERLGDNPGFRKTEKSAGQLEMPGGRNTLLSVHTNYLKKRNMNAETITKLWGAEGIGQVSGKWNYLRWRLFIPIFFKAL